MKEFTINRNDSGQRVDKFLQKAVPRMPQSLMYKYIRMKRIKLNGKRCEISTRLNEGDVMQLYINDEFFDTAAETEFLTAPPVLNIVYEDENILLVDKKNGLVVHEDDEKTSDTLINRILHYLYDKGEYKPEEENSFVPALCNRLDRNTGGIVIAAKNADSLRILNAKMKTRELEKYYLCLLYGKPKRDSDTLHGYMTKNESKNKVTVFKNEVEGSKEIKTKYEILDFNGKFSLAEVELLTGRTHQIRAHMASIGHPLVGDGKYAVNKSDREKGICRQALCSYKLIFTKESGVLGYLAGKTVEIPRDKISFAAM